MTVKAAARELVDEVWGLELDDGGGLVSPAPDNGTESFLAFPSKKAAERAAEFLWNIHDVECHPIWLA